MRIAEFLVFLLEAQGETLRQLSQIVGTDRLLELLEQMGDSDEPMPKTSLEESDLDQPAIGVAAAGGAYAELAAAVGDLRLPEVLEFHLWAYPFYRTIIESGFDLNSRLKGSTHSAGTQLVDEAMQASDSWLRRLAIPPQLFNQAERVAQIPWVRFRTQLLRRLGKRPLGPVY